MEQQTVSIAKAGIIAQLNARTSILAASNPIDSRYNPKIPVTKNINLPPSLLSRFDLIYLVLDIPERKKDIRLAEHLISLYWKEDEQKSRSENFIDDKMFEQYIAYSRKNFNPQIKNEAANELINQYMKMRNLGRSYGRKTITATPRTLESIISLSEALARIRHSHRVEIKDVKEATRLQEVATL
jgi:DNA replication licensing factor MCM4